MGTCPSRHVGHTHTVTFVSLVFAWVHHKLRRVYVYGAWVAARGEIIIVDHLINWG